MVQRNKKRSRKYLGGRSWGVGNIKNARGSGGRGGVGNAGRKSKFTRMVKYEKERVKGKGFTPWYLYKLKEVSLSAISRKIAGSKEQKPTLEMKGYKVLSNGILEKPAVIKASSFSKKAMEKIQKAGGEAVKL